MPMDITALRDRRAIRDESAQFCIGILEGRLVAMFEVLRARGLITDQEFAEAFDRVGERWIRKARPLERDRAIVMGEGPRKP